MQHWDLMFTKNRLEHKFCAWQNARLARLDALHATLVAAMALASMLWLLRPAGAVWLNGPMCMSGEIFSPPANCIYRSNGFL